MLHKRNEFKFWLHLRKSDFAQFTQRFSFVESFIFVSRTHVMQESRQDILIHPQPPLLQFTFIERLIWLQSFSNSGREWCNLIWVRERFKSAGGCTKNQEKKYFPEKKTYREIHILKRPERKLAILWKQQGLDTKTDNLWRAGIFN